MLAPFEEGNLPSFLKDLHISPLGAIPKKCGKIRPITHFSAPRWGISVNSDIFDAWATVKYTSVKELASIVQTVGPLGYVWSIDAKDAYLQIQLHEESRTTGSI